MTFKSTRTPSACGETNNSIGLSYRIVFEVTSLLSYVLGSHTTTITTTNYTVRAHNTIQLHNANTSTRVQ